MCCRTNRQFKLWHITRTGSLKHYIRSLNIYTHPTHPSTSMWNSFLLAGLCGNGQDGLVIWQRATLVHRSMMCHSVSPLCEDSTSPQRNERSTIQARPIIQIEVKQNEPTFMWQHRTPICVYCPHSHSNSNPYSIMFTWKTTRHQYHFSFFSAWLCVPVYSLFFSTSCT